MGLEAVLTVAWRRVGFETWESLTPTREVGDLDDAAQELAARIPDHGTFEVRFRGQCGRYVISNGKASGFDLNDGSWVPIEELFEKLGLNQHGAVDA